MSIQESMWMLAATEPINDSSTDNTILTINSGRKFVVTQVFIQAEAAVDVTFKSGSSALSGPIAFVINEERTFGNGADPVFVGAAGGDNFVITLSSGVQINGFVTHYEKEA